MSQNVNLALALFFFSENFISRNMMTRGTIHRFENLVQTGYVLCAKLNPTIVKNKLSEKIKPSLPANQCSLLQWRKIFPFGAGHN